MHKDDMHPAHPARAPKSLPIFSISLRPGLWKPSASCACCGFHLRQVTGDCCLLPASRGSRGTMENGLEKHAQNIHSYQSWHFRFILCISQFEFFKLLLQTIEGGRSKVGMSLQPNDLGIERLWTNKEPKKYRTIPWRTVKKTSKWLG